MDRTRGFRPGAFPSGERSAETTGPIHAPRGNSAAPTAVLGQSKRDQWLGHLADLRVEVHQIEDRLIARVGPLEASVAADSVAAGQAALRREKEEARIWNWLYSALALSVAANVCAIPALFGVLGILFFGRHG
jgi:hypothetical protein